MEQPGNMLIIVCAVFVNAGIGAFCEYRSMSLSVCTKALYVSNQRKYYKNFVVSMNGNTVENKGSEARHSVAIDNTILVVTHKELDP